MTQFIPTRTAALERLSTFLPRAGQSYASERNYDRGPGHHDNVSGLSPYIRHRVLAEDEVLRAVLGRHSANAADKFIQEVYWRSYWKGWLEMRPEVWARYQGGLRHALDQVQSQSGLRANWEAACTGETGIACFDAWAKELFQTGYLHNHARMWFASIWIFTLRLPWELGADFFLRHLLDGDPASNTLGWRWVAGLQTRGKTYLARASNISKYTEGRFVVPPGVLAHDAPALDGPAPPERRPAPLDQGFDPSLPTALVLHEDDLSPTWVMSRGLKPVATAFLSTSQDLSPLIVSPMVLSFRAALAQDAADRWAARLGPVTHGVSKAQALVDWARDVGAAQVVAPYAPVGPAADLLAAAQGIKLVQPIRPYDQQCWPHAKAGFFKFRDHIPGFVKDLQSPRAA